MPTSNKAMRLFRLASRVKKINGELWKGKNIVACTKGWDMTAMFKWKFEMFCRVWSLRFRASLMLLGVSRSGDDALLIHLSDMVDEIDNDPSWRFWMTPVPKAD